MQWICTGGGAHAALPLDPYYASPPANNRTILTLGYIDRFYNKELFANEVTVLVGSSDAAGPLTVTGYLTGARFNCSQYLLGKLIQGGTLPTITELAHIAAPGGPAGSAMCPTSGSGWPVLAP